MAKARSAAQKAATKKMLAANKAKHGGKTAHKATHKTSHKKSTHHTAHMSAAEKAMYYKAIVATRKKNRREHLAKLRARKGYKAQAPLKYLLERKRRLDATIAKRK